MQQIILFLIGLAIAILFFPGVTIAISLAIGLVGQIGTSILMFLFVLILVGAMIN